MIKKTVMKERQATKEKERKRNKVNQRTNEMKNVKESIEEAMSSETFKSLKHKGSVSISPML